MEYKYYVSYDPETDEFWAQVDEEIRPEDAQAAFEITSTMEMLSYIANGVMKHIDDIAGLEKFLKSQGYIDEKDTINPIPEVLY